MRKFIAMVSVRFKTQPPWFDDEIRGLCKLKDKLCKLKDKRAKLSNNTNDVSNFRKCRANFKQTILNKKREFIAADPSETSDNVVNKRFWSYFKSKIKSSRIPESVPYNGRYKCELFNSFFCDQFSECSSYNIDNDYTSEPNNTNYMFLVVPAKE